jgi:leader peptidase (prepilin peptidase) / N-methyltransferase
VTIELLVLAGVFGLMIGSFLNVCIGRIPAGESIVSPGSRCPSCRTPIEWYDNVPILGYVLLGGKCRRCRRPISVRYPLVEMITAVAFVLQAWVFGGDPWLLFSRLVFTGILIVLFGTDFDTQRLPDALTLPGIAIGLAGSLWLPPGIWDSLVGVALGAGILLAIRWTWMRLKGVDAMGLGDVKMLAMIGAFLGWKQVVVVLVLASFAGALVGIGLTLARGRSMQSRLPFGTFLALAAYIASLCGERLIAWYLGWSGI